MKKKFICPVCGGENVTIRSLGCQNPFYYHCPDCGSHSNIYLTEESALITELAWNNPVPEKIKPKDCPFCGSKAELGIDERNVDKGNRYYYHCSNKDECFMISPLGKTKKEALELWNCVTIAKPINEVHVASVRKMLAQGHCEYINCWKGECPFWEKASF